MIKRAESKEQRPFLPAPRSVLSRSQYLTQQERKGKGQSYWRDGLCPEKSAMSTVIVEKAIAQLTLPFALN